MKRARDLADVQHELEQAERQVEKLRRERMRHPVYMTLQHEKRRAKLWSMVPEALRPVWIDNKETFGGHVLTAIELECAPTLDEELNCAVERWDCTLHFERRGMVCFVVNLDFTSGEAEGTPFKFNLVEWHESAVVLWRDALAANANDAYEAVAAFCFACNCEADTFPSAPSEAYPEVRVPGKGKEDRGEV